jgi:hypothetical protein
MYDTVENLKNQLSGKKFIFIGEKATTGTPHPVTGKMSNWGSYYEVKDIENAKEYASLRDGHMGKIVKVGTLNTLRKYSQGNSWYNYLTNLYHVDTLEF